ncbi:MAG: GNAT family N-acetyltransferase [Marinilabiliaceae bacterium]|nr:GNAT family N-acetyltransferase [Marinilabiliaceae bacterium]
MIKNDGVILRAVEPADIDLLYLWENQMEIWIVSNTITPFSKHQLERYVKLSALDVFQSKQLRLMIDYKESTTGSETVGMIDLYDFDPYHQRAGVGIMIHQKYRQRGIAVVALRCFVDYCFNTLSLHQLYCSISSDNKISQKLFENAGFKLIGIRKEWLKTALGFVDEYHYQLLKV